jgi:hypothetical protein
VDVQSHDPIQMDGVNRALVVVRYIGPAESLVVFVECEDERRSTEKTVSQEHPLDWDLGARK